MAEQSHRDEMNAAIRAQRERHAAPRTIAPVDETAAATPEPTEVAPDPAAQAVQEQTVPEPRRGLLDRLRGR